MTPSKADSDLVFMVSCASCGPIGVSITSFQSPSRAMSPTPSKVETAPADASSRRPLARDNVRALSPVKGRGRPEAARFPRALRRAEGCRHGDAGRAGGLARDVATLPDLDRRAVSVADPTIDR